MHFETVLVVLFAIATGVALIARRLRVPYTVALVVAGLALGAAHAFTPPHLTKDLLYAVFLPGLLFEAAFHLDYAKFAQNKLAIISLAVPGVAVAITLTAFALTPAAGALHFVDGFTIGHGLVFAALIAATDPIAVVGLFKSLGAPKRLAVIVEGESLLNDGTAVVAFTLIFSAVTGPGASVGAGVLDFIRIVGMGLVIGVAFGFAISKAIQLIDDPMVEITLTTIAAYGSFVAAEQFHFSGVIATVTAGMLCGNYGASTGMSPSTRIAVESFWEYLAFALNSVVFLLIGFSVQVETLVASAVPILVAFAAVTVARAAVVFSASTFLRFSRERIPWRWTIIIGWGGLRGGLSMVLALALDSEFPHRGLIVTMTYGVVILSILLQGMTMTPLMRWLRVGGAPEDRLKYEVHRGEIRAVRAALAALEVMEKDGAVNAEPAAAVRASYERRLRAADELVKRLHLDSTELLEEEEHVARRHLLQVEKQVLIADSLKGLLGTEASEELRREADARMFRLESGREEQGPDLGGAEPPESESEPEPSK